MLIKNIMLAFLFLSIFFGTLYYIHNIILGSLNSELRTKIFTPLVLPYLSFYYILYEKGFNLIRRNNPQIHVSMVNDDSIYLHVTNRAKILNLRLTRLSITGFSTQVFKPERIVSLPLKTGPSFT